MINKYTRLVSYLLRNQLPYWYGTFKSQDYEAIKHHLLHTRTWNKPAFLCYAFEDVFNYEFNPMGDINYPELTPPEEFYNVGYNGSICGPQWYIWSDYQSRLDKLDEAIDACYRLPMIQLFGTKIYNIVFP